MPLTDMEIRAAKPSARLVKLSDGGGLQLWIMPNEAKRNLKANSSSAQARFLSVELKQAGITQRDALLQICDEARVWRSLEGEAFASLPVRGHIEHHPLASRSFRNWMLHRLACSFAQNGRPASANENAVRDSRAAIEARALVDGIAYPVALRLVEQDSAIYLDLGTPDWSVVKITADGWSVIPEAPLPILRGKRAAPFVAPMTSGDFEPLRRLLAHLDEDSFILLAAWCLGALMPSGPYPILVLGGEQGAGKSTLARLVQRIVDPVHGDLLQPPGDDRDLIAAAKANRVLAFDNLSGIRADLADSLCRLSTGSEIGGRALYTDHDVASFAACRPLVLNGIPDLAARGDLADRSIVLRLGALGARKTERDWRAAVDAVLPATFAGLLDALSLGLQRLDRTPTPNVRMADFARLVVAAEPALPWKPGAFVAAYQRSSVDAAAVLADGDQLASTVRVFMKDEQIQWSGLVSELYQALSRIASSNGTRPADWPGNARWFGDRMRRLAPTLRALGIDYRERRGASGTKITLSRIASLATPEKPSAATRAMAHDAANGASVATKSLCAPPQILVDVNAISSQSLTESGHGYAPTDFPDDFGKNGGA